MSVRCRREQRRGSKTSRALIASGAPSMLASIARIHWRHGCPTLLGRAAQSSPEAAPRRAKGAGLYGEGADRAIIYPPQDGLSPGDCPGDRVPIFTA